MRIILFLVLVFSANVLALSKPTTDEEYSKKILGVWVAEYKSGDRSLYAETLYKKMV